MASQLHLLALIHRYKAQKFFRSEDLVRHHKMSNPALRARLRRLVELGLLERKSYAYEYLDHPEFARAYWRLTSLALHLLDHFQVQVQYQF